MAPRPDIGRDRFPARDFASKLSILSWFDPGFSKLNPMAWMETRPESMDFQAGSVFTKDNREKGDKSPFRCMKPNKEN